MGQENVEVVLRQTELWNEGDLDGAMEAYAPDVVVLAPKDWPDGSITEGVDAWKRQAQRLRESWEAVHAEVDEIRSVGNDRVVARFRYVTRGKDPGISFETPMAVVFDLKDRKIIRAHYYWEIAQALEAAGLEE